MFRFDNPDALLMLLLVAGAYATVRAVDAAIGTRSTWWLVAAGAAVGFGFLTKMGQALLVVPAFGLVYLVAGAPRLRTRLLQLLAALGAMVVSAGWFIALVELWPADSGPTSAARRPTRCWSSRSATTASAGSSAARQRRWRWRWPNTGFGGATGIPAVRRRVGLEISWLLPAALIALVAWLVVSRRAPRTDRLRAADVLWGGWTLVTGLVFSFMSGTIHPYYTVALAPGDRGAGRRSAAGAVVAPGRLLARVMLALMVAATAAGASCCWPGRRSRSRGCAGRRRARRAGGRRLLAGAAAAPDRLAGVVAAVLTGLAGSARTRWRRPRSRTPAASRAVGTTRGAMGGPAGRSEPG